jgi:hypothetical protein
MDGTTYQLLTEAQWEYIGRAGATTRHSFGNEEATLSEYAWWKANSQEIAHPVGQKRPNAWGLYDVYGNAWEWCADWHALDYYQQSPTEDPGGPSSGSARIVRGGSWCNDSPDYFRCAYRNHAAPDYRDTRLGFRLAAEISAPYLRRNETGSRIANPLPSRAATTRKPDLTPDAGKSPDALASASSKTPPANRPTKTDTISVPVIAQPRGSTERPSAAGSISGPSPIAPGKPLDAEAH